MMYHSAVHSFVHTETGNLSLSTNSGKVQLSKATGDGTSNYEKMLEANANGSVDLYYDNSLRLGTRSWGVEVPNQTFQAANLVAFGGYVHVNQDNQPVKIGVGSDLSLLHDGSDSFIENITGNLHIRPKAGEEGIKLFPDGSVYLYYNNEIKLTTASWGVSVWGVLQANNLEASNGYVWVKHDNQPVKVGVGGDLSLLHDGTDSKITNITGNLLIEPKSGETGIKVIPDGGVELYHNNVKRAEALSTSFNIYGKAYVAGEIASFNCRFLQAGANLFIDNANTDTANRYTQISGGMLGTSSGFIRLYNAGQVELYHNSVKRFNTTADAVDVHGHINLGANTDDKRLRFGINNDLQMYHDGSNSYIDNSSGSLYLRPKASEDGIKVIPDGSVELYHDNVLRCATSADGITVTDRVTCAAITISDGQPSIIFEDTGANPDFILQNRDGTFAIRDFTSNVNRFLVNAGNGDVTVTGSVTASTGILFGSDTAAANTLNDYEEGTWTPNFSGLTASNTSNTCFYIKIGDMVTAWFRATMPTSTSTATATIGGLPFTIFNSSGIGIAGGAFSETNAGSDLSMIGNANTDNMFVLECNSSGVAVKTLAQISGKDFRGSITYRVA